MNTLDYNGTYITIHYNRKKFLTLAPCGLYYKTITIVIYDRNDSGQYYNTRITILIDDTSLSLCRQLQS